MTRGQLILESSHFAISLECLSKIMNKPR
jgi:hypothetical protein